MKSFPAYIGPVALGIKMGVIFPGCDLAQMVVDAVEKCNSDKLLEDRDVLCLTESVLARAQNNYVTVEDISCQVREKLSLIGGSKLGVVFPIASRNRFSLILEGLAAAVPRGEVIVVLSYPCDEVGNQVVPIDFMNFLAPEASGKKSFRETDFKDLDFVHPITKVNYIKLYKKIIEDCGAKANIVLSNDPTEVLKYDPDGVIVADIHTRIKTFNKIKVQFQNAITLKELCSTGESWSEWGLLGSNMASKKKLKLAPRLAGKFAEGLKQKVFHATGKDVEVIIYGDGAYKDPTTGIYELADPMPVFGATKGVTGKYREGVKYKYIADVGLEEGKTPKEIEEMLEQMKKSERARDDIEFEGTTPRKMEDLLASLADLVSGSADAGTPLVLVKGFI
ncbi:MAG TPA: hypothetical protein GX697_00990 [Firmicutes bacterium]|nr:hypothetical protein [Bacillota bacterium]